MKRAVVALMLVAGVAHADGIPAGIVKAPAGWSVEADRSAAGSGAVTQMARAIYKPAEAGAVLYVTRVEIRTTDAQRNVIASNELAEIEAAFVRQGSDAKTIQQTKRADASKQQLDAELAWRDDKAGITDHSRTIVAANDERVVAVTGQCLLSLDAPAALATACDAALASLEIDLALEVRVALAIVGGNASTVGAPPAVESPPPVAPVASGSATPSATMSDGSNTPLAPIVVAPPPRKEADRRPLYLGLGLIVIAALFFYNRRRRDRFEKETTDE